MSQETQQVAFRLPLALIKRIDRHARRLKALTGGRIEVSRTDAARDLIGRALDLVEAEERAQGGDS